MLVLELPRLKTVWKSLTKKRSLAKTIKPRELKVKTEKDCPNCNKGEHTLTIPPCAGYFTHPPVFFLGF
jgi:hypothetical protein